VKYIHNKKRILNSIGFVHDVEIKLISSVADCDILLPKIPKSLQNEFAALTYLVEGHLKKKQTNNKNKCRT